MVSLNSSYAPATVQLSTPVYCSLVWRQQKLIVKKVGQPAPTVAATADPDRLVACLERSPIKIVKLDPALGEETVTRWANACKEVGKTAFLRLPSTELPQKRARLTWWMKCLFDRIAALLLLLLFSPIMLAVACLILTFSPGSVFFRQWRVGKRGKLFRIIKFRTMVVGAECMHQQVMQYETGLHKLENDPRLTPIGRWLRKYSIDELPQLINVLRGEMSLVGPRPWALYDAMRVSPALRHRLNALPGITGLWQVMMRAHQRDIDSVNRCDLDYLRNWSPLEDLKILLLTIPKVLSGFGAY
jgi:lipopolysaccharide/colanic/teichoic acid biosynthesis glycosyltransferase